MKPTMKKDKILKQALLPIAAALLGTLMLVLFGNIMDVPAPNARPVVEPVNDTVSVEIIPSPSKTFLLEFLTSSLPTDLI